MKDNQLDNYHQVYNNHILHSTLLNKSLHLSIYLLDNLNLNFILLDFI